MDSGRALAGPVADGDTHAMVHGRYTSPGDRSLHVYLGDDDDKGHKVRRRQKSHALQAACVTIAALCGLLCLWGYPGAQGTPGGHTPKLHGLHSDSLAQATTGAVRTRADPFTSGAADGASSVIPSVVTSGSVGGGASPGGVVHPETLRRLLVASHGRLQWLDVDTGEADVIHEGRGVYYGLAPDGKGPHSGRVWVVSRPHNWRVPDGAKEAALLLDTQSGALLREVTLPSLFTHDMVRCGDKVRAPGSRTLGPLQGYHGLCICPLPCPLARCHLGLTLAVPRCTWRTRGTGRCGSCGPAT